MTPVEVALDLEAPFSESSFLGFTGPAEPRLCLVAAFALTSQLKRIVTAVDRVLPTRLPPIIRIAPPQMRAAPAYAAGTVSVRPMAALIRIQSRFTRAIEPGLANFEAHSNDMDEAASRYIREFIHTNAVPALEPCCLSYEFTSIDLKPLGITIYRLDRTGKPQSILGHWPYATNKTRSIPLRSGP